MNVLTPSFKPVDNDKKYLNRKFYQRRARTQDLDKLDALLRPLEREGILRSRGVSKLYRMLDDLILLFDDDVLCGCAALHSDQWFSRGELACIATAPQYRGYGVGNRLLKSIEEHAHSLGLQQLYLRTASASEWFAEKGFIRTARNGLPGTTAGQRQMMVKYLHHAGSTL